MRKQWVSACMLVFVLLGGPAAAQDTNILALAHDLDAVLEWDPLRDAGLIAVGDDRVCLGVGMDCALINYRVKVRIDPPVRRQGAVWLSKAAVTAIVDAMQKDRLRNVGERMRVASILIDPGHGGKDMGAVGGYAGAKGPATLREKDVNLGVALHLEALLKAGYPDRSILLTRRNDTFLELEERVEIANKLLEKTAETIVYLSIHANASLKKPSPTGFEVWILPSEYQRTVVDAATVGEENRDILPILNSMKEDEITLESTILAQQILAGLDGKIGSLSVNRGVRRNDWYVVRNARMPAVLVETGFVSNPQEAARLADDAYLKDVAMGLYNGIQAFVRRFEHGGGQ